MSSAESITCPICGMTSYHPEDVRQRWCGNCHGVTGEPPPPGFRWVLFRPGEGPRFGRLIEERWLELGSAYELVGEGAVFTWDGEEFRC